MKSILSYFILFILYIILFVLMIVDFLTLGKFKLAEKFIGILGSGLH